MRYLLIHDTRSVGFLTGVVLTRLLSRLGDDVRPFFDQAKTRHAQTFWPTTARSLDLSSVDRVILCCLTFSDIYADDCKRELGHFTASTGQSPLILSHRWPDGYEDAGYDVLVPPFDLLERYAPHLEPADRELLRLSLIISRQADPFLVPPSDIEFADRLGTAIWQNPDSYWTSLKSDPAAVLQNLRDNPSIGQAEPLTQKGNLETHNERYAVFNLDPTARGHAEKILAAMLAKLQHPPPLAIGILNDRGDVRVHMVRPWGVTLPSIEYILETYAEQFNLPAAPNWGGPQDAKSLRFKYAKLDPERLPELKASLQDFAEAAYKITTGERRPVAGLARLIHLAAVDALSKLDLTKAYTQPDKPTLYFDPLRVRLLIDRGNRTAEPRSTLLLRLVTETADAASFLFRHDGYNLAKLERLLEGVLIGMGSQRSIWLGSLSIPDRLRVDASLGDHLISALPDAMGGHPEIQAIPVENAVKLGILKTPSIIYSALTRDVTCGTAGMIVYRESETIGPSVPYALAVGALAEALGMSRGKEVDVLDLFSGSALVARTILSKQPSWRVYCVDRSISASIVGLAGQRNVIWLKADVQQVLSGEEGILQRDFDLIAMDPPHSSLFDLLFLRAKDSRTLLQRLHTLAPWLIVYQGHASQVGRAVLVQAALKNSFSQVRLWHIGPEVITVAGPDSWMSMSFNEIFEHATDSLTRDCKKYELDLREVGV